MTTFSILWRGISLPGHEYCRLITGDSGSHLEGVTAFSHQGKPSWLSYHIACDPDWHTLYANIEGWIGTTGIDVQIRTDTEQHWWVNKVEVPEVKGCIDIDLNFSPSTNLIPIRRLNLTVGGSADLTAAWLRFPSFTLEPLPQRYQRLEEAVYRYDSGGGKFVADLRINRAGFVTDYPGAWEVEATSE